jgi:hypothetical protein
VANYVKATNFATKDTLASGNPAKIVKGTEIDTEFNAIAAAIASKPDADSPTLTGTPLAPTPSTATNNTQVATTAYVVNRITQDIAGKANIASPTFTGTPAAPTATAGTNTTQLATTAFVQAALQAIYPIGSIYINATNSTNPGTLLGFGTWTAFGAGRVPVGFNASDPLFDTAEETGGSKDAIVVSHTHTFSATTASAGTHTHQFPGWNYVNGVDGIDSAYFSGAPEVIEQTRTTESAGAHTHTLSGTTASTGSSGTNANLQPYITVYMWKRTA